MRCQSSLANVHVYQNHLLAGERKTGCKVAGHVSFACSWSERAECHYLEILRLHIHVAHVSSDYPEGLGHDVAALCAHYDVLDVVVFRLTRGILWNLTEERYADDILNVLAVADAGVEEHYEKKDDCRKCKPFHDSGCDHVLSVRRDGGVASASRVKDAGIAFSSGLAQGILLSFV